MTNQNKEKIRDLIHTETEENINLAEVLMMSSNCAQNEIDDELHGMTLALFLRMSVTILFGYNMWSSTTGWKGKSKNSKDAYQNSYFTLNRIFCKDGFSISVQIGHSTYCSSENGYRKLGVDWEYAEWGFPSEHVELLEEDAEDPEDMTDSIGHSSVKLLQEVLDSHGGISWRKTFSREICKNAIEWE